MHPNFGIVASSSHIFASDDIESPSPFDATGSALHAHYERVVHSSPLRERKVAWNPSSSFSQANKGAGTGMELRAQSVSGRFNRTLDAIVKNWGITYSGDKRTSVDNFLARLEEDRAVSFLSEVELLIVLPFFLDGLALQWFSQYKRSWPTWAHFRAAFRARFGDINYQWRLDEQVAARVQGEDELAADYLTCLQGLYQKFERPVSLIEQMDRVYLNMRPELKRAIRRHEFRDYDQLTALATDVERILETLRVERVPQRPEESFFPEFAYSGKNRPRPFIPNKQKPHRGIDPTVGRLFQSVSEIIRKLDDLITLRPYLDIEVGDAKFHSLVDTGSTKTSLGSLNVPLIP